MPSRIREETIVQEVQKLTVQQAMSRAKKSVKQGKIALAQQLYNSILLQQPNHSVAKKALQKLQKKLNRHDNILPPADKVAHATYLFDRGHLFGAELACLKLLDAYPNSFVVYNLLGMSLKGQGKMEGAVEALRKSINLNSDFGEAYYNLGVILNEENRFDEACELYRESIRVNPELASAHYQLSALKKYEISDPEIELMEQLCSRIKTGSSDEVYLRFALAKAYNDLEEYGKSFNSLRKANKTYREIVNYTVDKDIEVLSLVKNLFSSYTFPKNTDLDGNTSPQIIFIVGMPRSGTTLVEQIISNHSAVYGAGELTTVKQLVSPIIKELLAKKIKPEEWEVSQEKIDEIRVGYLEVLKSLNVSARVITDKMPLNLKWIGFILAAFPKAKIIHLNRDPVATCWSMYKHHFGGIGNSFSYDLDDIVKYYSHCSDLMALWRKKFPGNIYDIHYEELTENPETEIRKLLSFCNLAWEDECLNFHSSKRIVNTASATQVRKKMYTGSSDAWKNYERFLQPLIEGLKEIENVK